MARTARKHRMNEFGRTVMSIAFEHGFETRAALLKHLEAAGEAFSSERVGGWFYGRNQVDASFPKAFARHLPLTREQYTRLAVAFMDGQGPARDDACGP